MTPASKYKHLICLAYSAISCSTGSVAQAASLQALSQVGYFSPYSGSIGSMDYDVASDGRRVFARSYETPLSQIQIISNSSASENIDLHSKSDVIVSGSVLFTKEDLKQGASAQAFSQVVYDNIATGDVDFQAAINILYSYSISSRISRSFNNTTLTEALQLRNARIGQVLRLGNIEVLSYARAAVVEISSGRTVSSIGVGGRIISILDGTLTGDGFTSNDSYRTFGSTVFSSFFIDKNGNENLIEEEGDLSLLSEFDGSLIRYSDSRNYAGTLFAKGSEKYRILLTSGCMVLVNGLVPVLPSSYGRCDSSRSLYWNGLTDIVNLTGTPGSYLVGEDGTDFVNRSPLASNVPEPETWSLMMAGFAVLGIWLRDRRRFMNRAHL